MSGVEEDLNVGQEEEEVVDQEDLDKLMEEKFD